MAETPVEVEAGPPASRIAAKTALFDATTVSVTVQEAVGARIAGQSVEDISLLGGA